MCKSGRGLSQVPVEFASITNRIVVCVKGRLVRAAGIAALSHVHWQQ